MCNIVHGTINKWFLNWKIQHRVNVCTLMLVLLLNRSVVIHIYRNVWKKLFISMMERCFCKIPSDQKALNSFSVWSNNKIYLLQRGIYCSFVTIVNAKVDHFSKSWKKGKNIWKIESTSGGINTQKTFCSVSLSKLGFLLFILGSFKSLISKIIKVITIVK